MKKKDIILNGLIRQNPIFKLVLGTCPTLALTTAGACGHVRIDLQQRCNVVVAQSYSG